jgi:hypothetical protein
MATTKANVLAIAPELSTLSDDTWDLILADVANDLSATVFGSRLEQAARYLAAHRLTLIAQGSSGGSGGQLTKEKTGDEMREYSDGTRWSARDALYARTQYGLTFLEIRNRSTFGFRVVKPGV